MSRKAPLVALPPLVEEADAVWAGRAEGGHGGHARLGPVRRVVALLRAELAEEPLSVEAHWRLTRALYFAGEYASTDAIEAKARFLEATRVAEECLSLLRARASEHSSRDLTRATPVELVPRLTGDAEAVSSFEWGAVAWGMYALAHGMVAAAREGAAVRVRDLAEATLRLDPVVDDAAGDRALGRLHHKTPAIPLVTGWISGGEAVRHLRRAVAAAPSSLVNRLFLAEALYDLEPSRRDEALAIAEAVVRDDPDPRWLVEHERARVDAAAFLAARAAHRLRGGTEADASR